MGFFRRAKDYFVRRVIKDQRGIWPAVIGAGASLLSSQGGGGGGQQNWNLLNTDLYQSDKPWWQKGLFGLVDPGGGLAKTLGFGDKKSSKFEYFDPYPEQRKQLMDLLYTGSQQGVPGLEQFGQERFQEQLPGIRELFEGRRQLGVGSTPEVAALGRSARGVATDVSGMQAQAQQNYARTLAGLLGQPTTAVTPPGPSGFENLLSFGAPVASSFMQGQGQQQLLQQLLGGGAEGIAPEFDPFGSDVNSNQYDPFAGLSLG